MLIATLGFWDGCALLFVLFLIALAVFDRGDEPSETDSEDARNW